MSRSTVLSVAILLAVSALDAMAFMLPPRAAYPAGYARREGAEVSATRRICQPAQYVPGSLTRMAAADGFADEEDDVDHFARAKIEELISSNKIVLFMKGNKLFPSCGFSNTAVRILDEMRVPYETVDVLADERMRAEIKRFSQWPTIPMLYIQGELVGGSDIMLEMYQSGELQEVIEIAAAS